MPKPNTNMFDTKGFSVDLLAGGWEQEEGFGSTYTFFLQVRCRLCCEMREKTTTNAAGNTQPEDIVGQSMSKELEAPQHTLL